MGSRQGEWVLGAAVPGGHRAGKAGLRPLALVGLTALVALALQLGSASIAHAATFNWYGEGNSTCIQNGQPPSSSSTNCGVVGEWYLNGSNPVKTREGALVGDVGLTQSGDYCNAYNLNGGPFYTRDYNNEEGLTGFNPSPPDTMTNGHGSVCQAQGTTWGQGLRPDAKATCGPCGMQHYVSFASQKDANGKASLRPWSNAFAGPALVIEGAAHPQVVNGSPAWGYLCPLFEWVNSPTGQFFEYCFVEWSQWGLPAPGGEVLESGNFNGHQGISLRTDFAPGTSFSTEIAGSGNSVYGTHTESFPFKAAITEDNLKAAIKAANLKANYGLSENPSEYALIGVEQGTEQTFAAEVGEKTENLKLYTEFSHYALKPAASTQAPSNVSATEARINGSVNPEGSSTEAYFEYGRTTSYGSRVPSGAGWPIGSGTTFIPAYETLKGLAPGATYHYRVVGVNANGTSVGEDQTFTTPQPSLNGDRYADLVECNNNEYLVATSNGSSLNAPTPWSTWGCGPLVQTGDFTGDGKTDLVVPAGGNKWVVGVSNGSSFNGPGTQTWTESLNSEPTWDGAADVNGDGKADLVTCKNNEYKVATSNGSSLNAPTTWSTWGCGPLTRLGDFTGDGKTDLIVPAGGNKWVVGVSNGSSFNGPGTQTWTESLNSEPTWDGAADVNGDGKADLVTCKNNEYKVATSNGSSLNAPTTWSTWGCGPLTRLADVNGDGKADLLVPGVNNTWAVAISSGTGFNAPGTQTWLWGFTNNPTWDGAGDVNGGVNGGGRADLVECNNNEYLVATSNGSSLNAPTPWSTWGCGPLVQTGDFTGDGKTDLVVPAGGNKWVVGVSNGSSFNGPGTQTWTESLNSEPTWDGAADANGDGKADLVTCKNNEYKVATSNGSSLNAPTTWSTWGCGPLVQTGDFTGDGKTDLIVPAGGNKWVVGVSNGSSFNGPGTQTWTESLNSEPTWDGAADVNGDGKADLVTCKNNEYKVATSNGSSLNAPTTWSTWGCGPLTRLADVNGDGKADLLVPGVNNTWAVAISSGTGFNAPGTQTWLWGFTNNPTWDGAG